MKKPVSLTEERAKGINEHYKTERNKRKEAKPALAKKEERQELSNL